MRIEQILILVLCLLLISRLFFFYQERHIYKENEKFEVSYSFLHEPKKNTYGQYFFIDSVLVTLPLYPQYYYGDSVKISGVLEKKKAAKGELLVVSNPKIIPVEKKDIFLAVGKFVRQKVENAVLRTLPARESGLLLGIILGVRDKIDKAFYEELRGAGVLHVIAASGQNVSIVASLLLVFFQRLVKRRLALLFTASGLLFYALLTGFDPPILRASIMALITFGALAIGRQSSALYALCMTGWGIVFVKPELLEDISFQLSFLSTFGILVFKPLIDKFTYLKFISFIKDDIGTTISAQLATFPLMLMAFGSYSWLSFPVNILILWTVPIIMIFAGLGAVASLILPQIAIPFIFLAYPFLAFFTGVVHLSSNLKFFITATDLPLSILIGYYMVLGAFVLKFKNK